MRSAEGLTLFFLANWKCCRKSNIFSQQPKGSVTYCMHIYINYPHRLPHYVVCNQTEPGKRCFPVGSPSVVARRFHNIQLAIWAERERAATPIHERLVVIFRSY